jgi:hypothetical protein
MKPDKQRIAIAEACGWKWTNQSPRSGTQSVYSWYFKDTDNRVQNEGCLPEYLTDLNAMHEAEGTLNWDEQASTQADEYRMALTTICGHDRDLIHVATASQRAEAFLKTIGKWDDKA